MWAIRATKWDTTAGGSPYTSIRQLCNTLHTLGAWRRFSPLRCWRVGEVTFLMQGVSWPSARSWEESLERSPERRLSLQCSGPCMLILATSLCSWEPRSRVPLLWGEHTNTHTHTLLYNKKQIWNAVKRYYWYIEVFHKDTFMEGVSSFVTLEQ